MHEEHIISLTHTVANGAVGTAVSKRISQPWKFREILFGTSAKNKDLKLRVFVGETDEAPTAVGDSGQNIFSPFGNVDYYPSLNLQTHIDIAGKTRPPGSYIKLQTQNDSGASIEAVVLIVIELLPRGPKPAKIEP